MRFVVDQGAQGLPFVDLGVGQGPTGRPAGVNTRCSLTSGFREVVCPRLDHKREKCS